MTQTPQCRHCTVPLNDPIRTSQHETDGVCGFCAQYVPPVVAPSTAADQLGDAIAKIDGIRAGINAVIRDLPDETGMFIIVDVVSALWNLRNASVMLDKANEALESDAESVQR